jgi:XTP/dITP diphosphohydrolase
MILTRRALVVATTSRGKFKELASLLAGLPVEVRAIGDVLQALPRVVEDGATFAANAIKKAQAAADATGMMALADDSGLEVDALDGRPGLRSARFAHDRATDAENNAALLAALDALGKSRQATRFPARFRCVLAVVDPSSTGEPWTVDGVCEGAITRAQRGAGGFGYDSLFVVAGTEKTMAELELGEKNRLSHRARAVAELRSRLAHLLAKPGK